MFHLDRYDIYNSFATVSLRYNNNRLQNKLFTSIEDADTFINSHKHEFIFSLMKSYVEDMAGLIESSLVKKFLKRRNVRECRWAIECLQWYKASWQLKGLIASCKYLVILHDHLQAILPSPTDKKNYEKSRERLLEIITFCKAEIEREHLTGIQRHPLTLL